jgi:hypothetical protein
MFAGDAAEPRFESPPAEQPERHIRSLHCSHDSSDQP